jgi:hypothetical protein
LQSSVYYCIDTDDSHEAVSSSTNNAVAVSEKGNSCSTKKAATKSTASTSKTSSSADTASQTSKADTTVQKSSGSTTKTGSKIIGGLTGLLELVDPVCGASDPSKETTDKSGPNGALEWLNCGISKSNPTSGWTPPAVKLNQVIYKNLTSEYVASSR